MKAKAAVFYGAGKPFQIQEFPLLEVEPGGVLVKVSMSTICGSDLHTWHGKRDAPLPVILGHEISGEIAEIGKDVTEDIMGNPLAVGDRITWTIMASCGRCYYCKMKNLPQKCLHLFKYGHESCQHYPYLHGGLAEYIYLKPGTGIFKIPEELSDEEVTPINCALATVVNGLETIEIHPEDNVVVQGAGMLGICAIALLRERSAGKIIALDKEQHRLQFARQFGADEIINVNQTKPSEFLPLIKDLTRGYGADVVIEVSGNPDVIPQGIEMLSIGGRYLLIGTVFPEANFTLDGYLMTTKIVTLKGVHNYETRHLGEGLTFVARTHKKYPFSKLITHHLNLEEVNEAFELATNLSAIRVAVIP
jgi:putative phosphonate catabolism associated alcohol dehydrogenase